MDTNFKYILKNLTYTPGVPSRTPIWEPLLCIQLNKALKSTENSFISVCSTFPSLQRAL